MAVVRRRNWLLAGLAVIILVVIALAWIDGGRQPLRVISEPVALPPEPPA
ncbi:MAG: hypothetical protein N2423_05950 [Novosphingobium sp.]|nr:hypothetical protein [Novosphingobium sp.]